MSNIYVHEPPTNGKVLLQTTVGDIEIELWSKEAPKACRNFVQLCLEGYYNKTIFHRVVKDFIVQGGDPMGDGASHGESIYGKPFSDEFHSRIRFVRRGLVAMANSGPNDNTSHFFFTLAATPELNNKNTIFGRIGGDTIYNALKLADGEVDRNDKPLYPHKILKTKVIVNPFDDIVPRILKSKTDDDEDSRKKKSNCKATKNFGLLSFGDEAEKEEIELVKVSDKIGTKAKSSHDLLNDSKLAKTPAYKLNDDDGGGKDEDEDVDGDVKVHSKHHHDGDDDDDDDDYEHSNNSKKARLDDVKKKLKKNKADTKSNKKDDDDDRKKDQSKKTKSTHDDDDDEKRKSKNKNGDQHNNDNNDLVYPELQNSSKNRIKKLKDEVKKLKKELWKRPNDGDEGDDKNSSNDQNHSVKSFKRDLQSYEQSKTTSLLKGADREKTTLELLSRFQNKLDSAKRLTAYDSDDDDDKDEEEDDDKDDEDANNKDLSWMTHKLKFNEEVNAATTAAAKLASQKPSVKEPAILSGKVLDANVADSERYIITDPRNPIAARRRKESAMKMKKRK